MLKIALYEIQTGHHSPDQWAKDTCDRRCLQWLGLGIAPSRSRWYAFRDRVGPLLETFHRQILEGAVAQGLTTASRGSLDGTLIAAHASRHRLVNLSRLRRRLEELDRVIAADKTRQDPGPIPGWMARHPATRQRQRYRFREAQRKLLKEHARNACRPRDQRQDAEKIVISTSDFQAALGRDKEKVFRPLYNLQVVQDIESPLVLGYEVFAQATDAGTLMPLRQRAHDLTGIWLKEILADAGYASALDLFDCASGCATVCPLSGERPDGAAACPATAAADPQERIRLAGPGAGLCVPARTSADADQPGDARASRRAHGGGEDLSLSQGALSAVPAGTAVHQQRKGTNNQAE